jgi:2-oxoisovalerate dehydrogenase E1 component
MAFPKPPAILATRDLRAAELENPSADALLRVYAWMHLARTYPTTASSSCSGKA